MECARGEITRAGENAKKLTPELEALGVESFDTGVEKGEGSVIAHWEMTATRTNVCRTPCCPETFQVGRTG